MNQEKIEITGENLTVKDIARLVKNKKNTVSISDTVLGRAKKSEDFLHREINNKILYGINTGFGPMASHILAKGQLEELQINLIRSHAVGMGKPIDNEYVLAAMIVRLNTLVKGFSGVSPELLKLLASFINKRIIPVVPEHGAVGTSGDLVQLAHIALALTGGGQVFHEGTIQNTSTVLKKLMITPHSLKPKEGLALINGTSVMSGIGAILIKDVERLIGLAMRNGALSLELVHAFDDSISERLNSLRPHHGQTAVAKNLRNLLKTSKSLKKRSVLKNMLNGTEDVREMPEAIQEIYSLRCIPQILGPIVDQLAKSKTDIETEINSVTDNPIIDAEQEKFLHGGNFHGDQIASTLDFLKIAVVKMTILSERRINFFLNHSVNKIFPPFLNLKKPGLTLGLQGLQFVATSTAAQNQSLAFPHHIHSIPTNSDNQDVVSMGTDAALLATKVVENAYIVLTIEALTLAQAVDFKNNKDLLSEESLKLFSKIRTISPVIIEDREMKTELQGVLDLLRNDSDLAYELET